MKYIMPAAHVCNHCGAEHPSRNALFRHLSERCDPTAPAGPPNERIALAVSYIGSGFHGAKQSAEEDEVTRPTVAGAVLRAARCAWGASVVSDAVPACDTERATHACENLLVLSVARGAAKDEAALRAALPPELTLSRRRGACRRAARRWAATHTSGPEGPLLLQHSLQKNAQKKCKKLMWNNGPN